MAAMDTSGGGDRGSVHYPSDNLISVIIRAWTDDTFRKDLLTFDDSPKPSPRKEGDYAKTKKALHDMGVFIDYPVVLTHVQFEAGFEKEGREVVFVLPKEPTKTEGKYSIATARAAMQFCIFGM